MESEWTLKVEGSHTAVAIKKSLQEAKNLWNVNGIIAMSDNAANEVKAFNLLAWPRLSCFGHNLNLSAKAGIALPEIAKIIAIKGHNLISCFHRSPLATSFLKDKQEDMPAPLD